MRRQIFGWIFTVVVPLLFFSGVAANDLSPPGHYQITVVSNEFGSDELVTYDLDGGSPTRFGPEGVTGLFPAWSPAGKRIAFVRDEILVMDADGSNESPVTSDGGNKHVPTWSPDGSRIAFQHNAAGPRAEVWVVNSDGSNPTLLIREDRFVGHPAWSPDGKHIAYSIWTNGRAENLRLFNLDTAESPVNLKAVGFFPAWSPDGTMLLMSAGRPIAVCDTAGESTRSLISNGTEAAWSPDGRYIAYVEIDHSAKGVGTRHDLVIFDVVNETHRTMLKRKLPPSSGRPSWKPFPRAADQ